MCEKCINGFYITGKTIWNYTPTFQGISSVSSFPCSAVPLYFSSRSCILLWFIIGLYSDKTNSRFQGMTMIRLLPYVGDIEIGNEPIRMNVLMRMNTEQIIKILSEYSNDDSRVKVVIKDGKVVGFKIFKDKGRVEIIKCSFTGENVGKIYQRIPNRAEAVNLGPLDYRVNLINYKGEKDVDLRKIEGYKTKVRIMEKVCEQGAGTEEGIKCDGVDLREFPAWIVEQMEVTKGVIDWRYAKLVKSFGDGRYKKRLYIEGYRPHDSQMMLYTGGVDDILTRPKVYKGGVEKARKYVSRYQKVYPIYYRLYDKIRRDPLGTTDQINNDLKRLIEMHNELEELRHQLEVNQQANK